MSVEYDPADFQLDHAEAVAAIIELQGYAVEPVRADADRGRPPHAYTIGVEDLLGSFHIARTSDVRKLDRKIAQLNRKLKELEAARASQPA